MWQDSFNKLVSSLRGLMKSLKFEYKDALIEEKSLLKAGGSLIEEIRHIKDQLSLGNNTNYVFANIVSDTELRTHVKDLAHQLLSFKPTMLIVVGIGGSNLGTVGIFQALNGTLYNNKLPDISFYCADTIDTYLLTSLLELAKKELINGNNIIVNIVTKSGKTSETLMNGALFIDLLKKYRPDYYKYIVITTDKDSPLWSIGKEQKYHVLEIPKLLGGRYSVLSAVGLFPLALMSINIDQLVSGALSMRSQCLHENILENHAALSALIIYDYYKKNYNIHDTFIFSPDCSMLGAWYRQLVGESLGKKNNKQGDVVHAGITPTVSIGTTDLHSVAQLYLGGPRDKITTFVSIATEKEDITVPDNAILKPVPLLKQKSVNTVKDIILKAVKISYSKEKMPFMSIILNQKTEHEIGQFLMFKMFEIVYLAKLLDINGFDQPAVELYKEETRKLLQSR